MKTISKQEIKSIVREFKALAKGKNIKVNLPTVVLPPLEMHICWEEDSSAWAYYDDYPSCKQLSATYNKVIEQEADKQVKIYNVKINEFINKVIALENKYSLPRDQLWKDHLWALC